MVCYIVWSTIVGFFERVIFLAIKERHRRQVYVCGVLHCSTLSNWSTIKYILYSEIKIAVQLSTFRYIVEYNGLHALYSKYLFCFHDIIINDDMLRLSRYFFLFWYQIFGAIKIVCNVAGLCTFSFHLVFYLISFPTNTTTAHLLLFPPSEVLDRKNI